MSYDLVGRNKDSIINLGATHVIALKAVLIELTGKDANFLHRTSEHQCEMWAKSLKDNLDRIKLIEGVNKKLGLSGRKYGFLVVKGTDIRRQFETGYYKHDFIDFEPSWELAKDLNGSWKFVVDDFINFLDSCGGIVEVV